MQAEGPKLKKKLIWGKKRAETGAERDKGIGTEKRTWDLEVKLDFPYPQSTITERY